MNEYRPHYLVPLDMLEESFLCPTDSSVIERKKRQVIVDFFCRIRMEDGYLTLAEERLKQLTSNRRISPQSRYFTEQIKENIKQRRKKMREDAINVALGQ